MKDYSLVLDSSCSETKEFVEKNGHFFVPFNINYEGKDYLDGINIKADQMKEKIDKGIFGKTGAIDIPAIQKIFDDALKVSKKIIAVSISKELSGMYNAFRLAADDDKYKDKVIVIESLLHTPFSSNIFRYAITEQGRKETAESMVEKINKQNEHAVAILALKDIKFLAASGRISPTVAKVGSIIGIQPTLIFEKGIVDPKKAIKARNSKKSVIKAVEHINDYVSKNNLDKNDWYIGIGQHQVDINRESVYNWAKDSTDIEVRYEEQSELHGVCIVHVGYDINVVSLFYKYEK